MMSSSSQMILLIAGWSKSY